MSSTLPIRALFILLPLSLCCFFLSCGGGQTAIRIGPVTAVLPDNTLPQDKSEIVKPRSFLILSPGTFHNEDVPVLDSNNWTGLYFKNGKVELEDIELVVTNVHDPILDGPNQKTAKKIECEPQGARYIIGGLSSGSVPLIEQDIGSIFPGTPYPFEYYGRNFDLSATAIYVGQDGDFSEIIDYQLILKTIVNAEERTQVLAATYQFDDAEMSILFIGDIDRDGWPDFIVDTSPKYSYRQITLFLSSEAEGKDLVKPVATFSATSC